jgi:DUF2075 family protein
MQLNKPQDLLQLAIGDLVSKRNLYDLIQFSKISTSNNWGGQDPNELKTFIVNIYKTMMLRGIKGTYVYACNKDLQDYFKSFIKIA